MEVAKCLLQVIKNYENHGELITTAVRDLQKIEDTGWSKLRMGYEERKRKLILKAVALLAPSDTRADVVEVDGVNDAELLVCWGKGWMPSALAIYLRHQRVSDTLEEVCKAELGDHLGIYAHSIMAAVWDHVELGDEGLLELTPPSVYACNDSGSKRLEDARGLCRTAYQPPHGESVRCNVLAFEASRDKHRRFALVTAVLVESATGKVMFYDHSVIRTCDHYTLDAPSRSGLEFQIRVTSGEDNDRCWATLATLCSMYAEVHQLPDLQGCQLVNSIIRRLEWGLKACEDELDTLANGRSTTWIPSRQDLKLIHNNNDTSTRDRLRRSFKAREALIEGIRTNPALGTMDASGTRAGRTWVLDCLADPTALHLGRKLVSAYKEQRILPIQTKDSASSSIFATYIYNSLGDSKVAKEYEHIFSSGKVNIREAASGTLIFVPHSDVVTMTTHGMRCQTIEVKNSQIFGYDSAARFALLPHLLEILGLRKDDALLATLVREMDNNAFLVADPMTFDVRACMTRSFEEDSRKFRVSTLHEEALRVAGADQFQGLVREAVSLLARLGATVPKESVGRACFYDITKDLKQYRDTSLIELWFDRGVILDGLGCDISGDGTLAILHVEHEEAFVIAPIGLENLSRRPPPTPDPELDSWEAALAARGLVMMRPVFDVSGELRLSVTRSKPGKGILSRFNRCVAK